MDTLGTELGSEENEPMDILGSKAFSNKWNFRELLTEIKFWSLPATWTSIKTSSAYCKEINDCCKMSCFQFKKIELTQNLWGLSCDYLIKGLQRRVFLQEPCQKELCKRLEFSEEWHAAAQRRHICCEWQLQRRAEHATSSPYLQTTVSYVICSL